MLNHRFRVEHNGTSAWTSEKKRLLYMLNNRIHRHRIHVLRAAAVVLCFVSCTQRQDLVEPKERILAQIGDKTISADEFIRRAEYTVRPPYCRGNHNLDKKIVLNSLIAEKLFAIEAGDTNRFINTEPVRLMLRGRKEQNMRQWLYEQEARNKAVIDTAQAKTTFKFAGRRYNISYFNVADSALVRRLKNEITASGQFEELFYRTTGLDTLPHRDVEWSKHEHDLILDSLFMRQRLKHEVIGPIQVSAQQHMLIKINGWIDRPAITETLSRDRWASVTEEYTERAATQLHDAFTRKVMKGKKIEFNPKSLHRIIQLLGPVYFQPKGQDPQWMEASPERKDETQEQYQALAKGIEQLYPEPLFKVDDRVWTVKDFATELIIHPLVFREKKFAKQEFGQQLQYAIMDMIRDRFLADVGYERGYDTINVIQRNVTMFKDNLSYQYQKAKYLHTVVPDSIDEMNYMPLIDRYLNPYVDALQRKYSDRIQVDVKAFDEIRLTRIDLSVTQENVPFAKVVPSFPLVTTDNALDYGRKLDK
jgi:hypothetical protein